MKIEITKEWCIQMAALEAQSACDLDIGIGSPLEQDEIGAAAATVQAAETNIAFGRFVRLMRRHEQLSLEKLAEDARIEITELVEIEDDARHVPDPRTVYQLAQHFRLPTPKLMQLAGLTKFRNTKLSEEAIRFAARSEPVEELNTAEREALEAFVMVLSERSEHR